MNGAHIVVLGGSGFVGRYLVSQLAAASRSVVVPTRRRERGKHLILLPTVEVIEANIFASPTLERLVRNDLWRGRAPERHYDALEWLYGWRVEHCLA